MGHALCWGYGTVHRIVCPVGSAVLHVHQILSTSIFPPSVAWDERNFGGCNEIVLLALETFVCDNFDDDK